MEYKKLFFVSLVMLLALPLTLAFTQVGSDSGSMNVNGGSGGIVSVGSPSEPTCGNDVYEELYGEDCDGADLAGESCSSLGYDSGVLTCSSGCLFQGCYNSDGGDSGSGGGGSSGGGGGSSCDSNWICTEWDVCENYTQYRTCVTECGLESNRPSEARLCTVEGESGDAGLGYDGEDEGGGFLSLFTGAFLGVSGEVWSGIGILVLVAVLAAIAYWLVNK